MAKGQTKKASKKSGKGKSGKKSTAGSGYDPTPHYKKVPEDYVAVRDVDKATEIRGRPIAIAYDPSAKTGSLTIEDIKGKAHTVAILTATMFDCLMFFLGEYDNLPKFRQSDKAYRDNLIKRALLFKPRVPLLFRCFTADGDLVLYGVMSDKWRPVAAEDHIDIVKDTLKECGVKATCKLTKSDGLHGGFIEVTPKGNDGVIQPEAHFDFGRWDGYNRVRGIAGGQVLACANQLTLEVRGMMGKLEIGSFKQMSEMHVGSDEKFADLVRKVAEAIGAYGTIVKAAQKVSVSEEKMKMIVQYYTDKNVISARTQALVLEAIKDKKIQQVKGTMYGLAMALSYVGTHNTEIKDGVKYALQKLGGEVLVVSQDPKGYWKIIQTHHDNKPKKEKPKADKPAKKPSKKPAKKGKKGKKGKGKSKAKK